MTDTIIDTNIDLALSVLKELCDERFQASIRLQAARSLLAHCMEERNMGAAYEPVSTVRPWASAVTFGCETVEITTELQNPNVPF